MSSEFARSSLEEAGSAHGGKYAEPTMCDLRALGE